MWSIKLQKKGADFLSLSRSILQLAGPMARLGSWHGHWLGCGCGNWHAHGTFDQCVVFTNTAPHPCVVYMVYPCMCVQYVYMYISICVESGLWSAVSGKSHCMQHCSMVL